MATSRRRERVQREAQRVLGRVLTYEVKDDRLIDNVVSLTRSKITPDFSILHIWVAIVGTETQQRGIFQVIERAKPFLRKRLGEELRIRVVPTLKLHLDETPNHAARIDELLGEVAAEREARERALGGDGEGAGDSDGALDGEAGDGNGAGDSDGARDGEAADEGAGEENAAAEGSAEGDRSAGAAPDHA